MNPINQISLSRAALIAGLSVLVMVITAPFAEIFVYPRLVIPGNAAETSKNILAHQTLFASAIFGYAITFICDVLAAWAFYILLKPVSRYLSLITAWFRIVYAIIAIAALLNLITVFRLLNTPEFLRLFGQDQLNAQVSLSLVAFKSGFHFAILFFGIHLILLGYLVFRSVYIPKILGILLIISGLGYFATSIRPFLFPNLNLDLAAYTFYGELIFILWLLIRGWKIRETDQEGRPWHS